MIFPQTALELNGVFNSSKKQALVHHDFLVLPGSFIFLLVPDQVPGLVSLLSFPFFFPKQLEREIAMRLVGCPRCEKRWLHGEEWNCRAGFWMCW